MHSLVAPSPPSDLGRVGPDPNRIDVLVWNVRQTGAGGNGCGGDLFGAYSETGSLEFDCGVKVNLHGTQMWDFMDRLVTMTLPRITDFGGLSHASFDGHGNYNIGIKDMNVFLEVEAQHGNMLNFPLDSARGCGIYVQTSTDSDAEAKVLLSALRFPFAPTRKPTPAPVRGPVGSQSSG